jgi:hypothetical protein
MGGADPDAPVSERVGLTPYRWYLVEKVLQEGDWPDRKGRIPRCRLLRYCAVGERVCVESRDGLKVTIPFRPEGNRPQRLNEESMSYKILQNVVDALCA